MLSAQHFINLMELGGGGNSIWLNAVSIYQSDRTEIAKVVKLMGSIYSNAKCVSVLLPSSDIPAFNCLNHFWRVAVGISAPANYHHFAENTESFLWDEENRENIPFLTELSQLFLKNSEALRDNVDSFVYWSRAWTFQEWAMAQDLEIAVEGGRTETLYGMKSLVLGVSMLLGRYALLHSRTAINIGISNQDAINTFRRIKRQFLDENLFLAFEEIDTKKVAFQIQFPSTA
jgi:hypothetical protein